MRTELDQRMDTMMAALTGEGGQLALGSHMRRGVEMPTIAVAPPTLAAYFAHYCQEHAAATFLVSDDERITFAEIHTAAMRIARGLIAEHGIAKGDRVGIAMRNSPAWIALYMGILIAGGVATLLNGWWQSEELAAAIEDVDCTLIFADAPRVDRLKGIDTRVIGIDDCLPFAESIAPAIGGADDDVALPEVTADDHATILFTSGSTGRSKGALSDHRGVMQGVFNYLAQAVMMLGLAQQDGTASDAQPSTLLSVPLFHVTAEIPLMLQSFAIGRKIVMMKKWDAEEAMRLIEKEKISYFVGVPLMSFEIVNHPNRSNYDLSSVTDFAAGGAPRPVEHVKRIDKEMGGSAPLIGYGLTETNAVGTGNWRTNYIAKPNSAGRPSAPLVDLAILDAAGKSVPQGERGEICIRSVANFLEYWGMPDATAEAYTDDGYFRTGDIGYLDEDGYVFIVDRKKDIIIRGGENISCLEVEEAIYAHDDVAECSVFGLPDDRYGEIVGAVYLTRDGASLSEAELAAFLETHLPPFKRPAHIWQEHGSLPRLGTQKIDRKALREQYSKDFAAA